MAETGSKYPDNITLLGIDQVAEATGESPSVIYDKIKCGTFPRPIKIGKKNKWRASTMAAYLDRLERKARVSA